ncbi:MAG TPA: Na-translocating system protein MpsC family protein [Solirubrobacterales bacterium]|nr:Na-translocating system protein MpsC family protein [Solirubrobacterales bacterium]
MSATVDGQSASRPALTEISNTAVALHREHFGRGPGAAKTHVNDNLVVCVLTDVFTPVERTLIEAGQEERVRETRAAHRAATEDVYKERMEAVLGRKVEAHLSSVHVDPDVAVDVFVLGPEGAVADQTVAATDGATPA